VNTTTKRALFWTPRILCIAFALFLVIFAFDVFDEAHGFWETAAALGMHLIPNFLLIIVLIVSWKREWFGALLFGALGVLYIVTMWRRFPLDVYLLIAGPLFVMAILFYLNWHYRRELRDR
jgi:hypothetical protein